MFKGSNWQEQFRAPRDDAQCWSMIVLLSIFVIPVVKYNPTRSYQNLASSHRASNDSMLSPVKVRLGVSLHAAPENDDKIYYHGFCINKQ